MDMPDLSKLREMMSQAQDMRSQMEAKLTTTTVEATSGGGIVTVRMNGRKEVLQLKIDPAVMGSNPADLELLEDLVIAAINEAGRRADDVMKSSVQGFMGNLDFPGLT